MADLTTGFTFAPNETITPDKFHQMVDAAFLSNLVTEELQSGGRFIRIVTPASPNTGDIRVGSDRLLEAFYNGVWNDLAVEPEVLVLTNKSGVDLVEGDVVVPDPANQDCFTISTVDVAPNVIGVLFEDIANNASGQVVIRGQVDVRIAPTFFVGQYTARAGEFLHGPDGTSVVAGVNVAAPVTSNSPRSDCFGICLQTITTGPTALATCYIWK